MTSFYLVEIEVSYNLIHAAIPAAACQVKGLWPAWYMLGTNQGRVNGGGPTLSGRQAGAGPPSAAVAERCRP